VMAVTPWIFYAVSERWEWRKFLHRALAASAGVAAAIISNILLLAVQLSLLKGSLGEGFKYIFWSFRKRSYGGEGVIDREFTVSCGSSLREVLSAYFSGNAFDVTHWADSPLWKTLGHISYGYCVILFAVFSAAVVLSDTVRQHAAFRRRQLALAAMLWFSFLAPLSWFVIFKGHSYVHLHMNFIVWHQPFMLLGALLVGSTLLFFISAARRSKTETNLE